MSTAEKLRFTTGVGRLVGGSLSVASEKDYHGKPRDKPQYFFALALAKADPVTVQLINEIMNHTMVSYSSAPHIQAILGQGLGAVGFAWKIDDGDNPKYADKVGYAGHYIFKFTTSMPINTCGMQNEQVDPAMFQNGYYVQVAGSTSVNGNVDNTAGIYMNPNMVKLCGYGEVIQTGPSAQQLFGNSPAQLPPGASATPLMAPGAPGMPPQQPMAPGAPGMPPQQPMAPGAPGMPPQQPMTPGMPPQQPMAPGAPGMPPQQPMTPGMPPQQPMTPGMPPQQPMAPGAPATGYAPHPGIMTPGSTQ